MPTASLLHKYTCQNVKKGVGQISNLKKMGETNEKDISNEV